MRTTVTTVYHNALCAPGGEGVSAARCQLLWCVIASFLAAALAPASGRAAGTTLIPPDSNRRVEVLDARVRGDATTVLYYTYPDLGDPNAGKPCPLNFYTVTLRPGLGDVAQEPVAAGVCGFLGARARLLPNGELLILVQDRIERWRKGQRVASVAFSSVEAIRGLGVDAGNAGQVFDLAANGDAVVALPLPPGRQPRGANSGWQVIGLSATGQHRWTVRLKAPTEQPGEQPSEQLGVAGLWAGTDGSALVYVDASPSGGASFAIERRLYPVSPAGELLHPVVIARDQQPDLQSLSALGPEDMSRLGELMQGSYSEGITRLNVLPRPGGGFDVLLDRSSGGENRAGQFLYRIGHAGQLEQELALTDRIGEHGLERWADFRVEGDRLILLSEVTASQPGVQARRDTYPQIAVSWMRLAGGPPLTRLVPLEQRYLAAVMNAGDEAVQRIDNRPGGEPVRLSRLGNAPLAIAIGYLERRFALRLDEAGEELLAWDEVYQQSQTKLAREDALQQGKAARQARTQQLAADMAAAVSMTPEEYAALSDTERKAAMIRSGDMDAMMAAAQKQATIAMQQMNEAQGQGAAADAMDPQAAAAMQQAMAALAAAGVDPSALAGTPPGAPPAGAAAAGEPAPEDVLEVDASQRGFVEFEHPDGAPVTLLVSDRTTEKELLRKTYDDGVIYEHVDFSRFQRPLAQIRVQYLDAAGTALEELTPAIAR
jgi:hypothetical protein